MCSRPTDEGSSESAAAVVDSSPSQTNLDRYRLHLYNYALQAERLRLSGGWGAVQYNSAGVAAGSVYPSPGRVAFPVHALFHPGVVAAGHGGAAVVGLQGADEPKPQHSYIGLIAMAILGSAEAKLVLSDIYQYILDNYPYFRTRGPGWRNSIRHNLSLNDCFVKAGRSANGKGHYWAIHPANVDDFKKGDFRRRKAQRKVRRHMGLAVDDDGNDSPSPPPLPPPQPPQPQPQTPHHLQQQLPHHHLQLQQQQQQQQQHHHHHHNPSPVCPQYPLPLPPSHYPSPFYFQPIVPQQQSVRRAVPAYRAHKRQFDVASLLAPDPPKRRLVDDPTTTTMTTTGGSCSDEDEDETTTTTTTTTTVTAYRNGGWEQAAAAGLLQRYYEQQLQAAHRLHAFRQSLGLQRMMINGAGQWPAVITTLDRNALRLQTPTPPSTPSAHQSSYDAGSCVAAQSTADDHIKSELVD